MSTVHLFIKSVFKNGETMLFDYNKFLADKEIALYKRFILSYEPKEKDLLFQKEYKFEFSPKFCIITEQENFLLKESLEQQTYNNFILMTLDEIQKIDCDEYIICNSFVSFAPNFLFEIVSELNKNRDIDFFYFDEDKIDEEKRKEPFFKPDFSPDTLRSCNYIGNAICISKRIFDEIEVLTNIQNKEYIHLYDIILKASEKANSINHISKVLVHILEEQYKFDSEKDKKAIAEHLERIGLKGIVKDGIVNETYKIDYAINGSPLVSIIIPNHNQRKYLEPCITSIREKSTYTNYEILIVENHSTDNDIFEYYKELEQDPKIKILTFTDEFNYSAVNNFAVKESKGDYLLLLNNDTEIITPSWIEELLMFAQRSDVGVVGAKLYYSDGTIQHAGVSYNLFIPSVEHLFRFFPQNSCGYANRMYIVGNHCMVTGACIMSSREKYLEVGGLDEQFKIAYNDIDYCLQLIDKNYLVIFNPFCELFHYESISRGYDDTKEKIERNKKEKSIFLKKLISHNEIHNDIYWNQNLMLSNAFCEASIKNKKLELLHESTIAIKQLQHSKSYRIGHMIIYPLSIPLKVFRLIRDYNLLKKSGLFDSEYYLANNEDVRNAKVNPIMHYLRFGWKEGRNPSLSFDNKSYLYQRPDVKVAGICPLVHYLKFGKQQ